MKVLSKQSISRLRQLIYSYYQGTTSVDEEHELFRTLRTHSGRLPADLEEEYRILKSIDPAASISEDAHTEDITVFCENTIDKLAAENNRPSPRKKFKRFIIGRYTAIAASVALLLAIGIAIFTYNPQQKQVVSYLQPAENNIVAGTAKSTVDSVIVSESSTPTALTPVVTQKRIAGRIVKMARDTVNTVSRQMAREITDTAEAIQQIEQVMNLLADKCGKASRASEVSKEVISKTKETLNTYLRYEEVI